MKVITLKQPWATLVAEGLKKYEFRSWKLNYRGEILIHAGMALEKDMAERLSSYNLNYYKGEIIGEATLVDCILVDKEFNKKLRDINPLVYGRSNHVETYAWKLENICKMYYNRDKISTFLFLNDLFRTSAHVFELLLNKFIRERKGFLKC